MATTDLEVFLHYGNQLMSRNDIVDNTRRFQSFFGCTPQVCTIAYNELVENKLVPRGGQPFHLLWALMFLKTYDPYEVLSSIARCNETTYRKWTWKFIIALYYLEDDVVSLN